MLFMSVVAISNYLYCDCLKIIMMDWNKIVEEIGVVTVISGLVVWLIKKLGEKYINQNMKNYEDKLQHKSDEFRAELNLIAEKYKSELHFLSQKATKLHDKRLENIEKLYSLLNDFYEDMVHLTTMKVTTGMTKEEIEKREFEITKNAEESGNKFISFYHRKKLFFDEGTCELIEEIITLLKDSYSDFSFKYIFGSLSPDFEMERVKRATEKIKEKTPVVQRKLESNFRDILGVQD